MKLRTATSVLLAALLTSACTGSPTAPAPTAKPDDSVFGFIPVAQYVIEAKLGDTHTQQIRITIGSPRTWNEYLTDHHPKCSTPPDPSKDLVVPMYFNVVNTSPAGDTPANIAAVVAVALDDTGLKGREFSMGVDIETDCLPLVPALGAAEQGPAGTEVSFLETQTSQAVPSKKELTWAPAIIVTGHGKAPLPAAALFLRLTPFAAYTSSVPYTITHLRAKDSIGGVVTEGKYKGVFFVPLVPGTSPCTTIGKDTKMLCGTELAPPE